MNKIVTITFNPALDKSSTTDYVIPEAKIRCSQPVYEAGGGGVNISRALRKLGGNSLAIYSKGGASGHKFEEILSKDNILSHPILCQSPTRENFIVVESSSNNQYRFGMPGESMSSAEVQMFLDSIESLVGCEYLIASGSLPKNVPLDIYATIGEIAKRKNLKYIVDSSEEALQKAFEFGVYIAKPNLGELAQLVGKELKNIEEQEAAAKEIIAAGKAEILVVSLGPVGAFVATKDSIFTIHAPSVKKKSTVGAGDSMVAGLIFSLSEGKNIEEAAMYGVASGTAATLNSGTELCKKEDVDRLFSYIQSKHTHLLK